MRSWPVILAIAAGVACGGNTSSRAEPDPVSHPGHEPDWFVDRAQETGLAFVHFNGMSGALYYPELMAPGVAMFDYDNDDDLDVFVVQGEMLGAGKTLDDALRPPSGPLPLKARVYRNDLQVRDDGARTFKFTDITDQSGIDVRGYGMGVATGDINNDGCVDLYVTKLRRNQLFRNDCDGTFTDISRQSGADDSGWSVSATFVDYDRDGWLDLFVGHYLNYSTEHNARCHGVSGTPDYCPPSVYRAQPNRLFHNNRNSTFTDVTAAAGMAEDFGGALGVVAADFNSDAWVDLYVANDGRPNQLWLNQRNGTFGNTALLAGVALSVEGFAKSSMGVDAGDFDNDGDEDIFITELTGQGSDLYVNDGLGTFEEQSRQTGIHVLSLRYTGFGTAWFDFDNDGWLDILTVNGLVTRRVEQLNEPFSLEQRMQVLRNAGGHFEDVTDRAGAVFELEGVGRGAAFGDIDNDGDVDVIVANDNGPLRLLVNQLGNRNHWIGLRLVGRGGRDMLGARVSVVRKDGPTLWRRARADGSYASANDPRILVGIGDSSARPSAVRVQWPDGRSEEWTNVAIDRYTTLKEGTGK